VDFNILSVVTQQLAMHPERVYRFYKQNGFRYIQLIPCLDRLERPNATDTYSLSAELYGKFLCSIFDLWYQDFIAGEYISIRAFDNYIQMLAGYPPESCSMAGTCQAYPLIEADGSVYPCDFYAVDEYHLGNIHTQNLADLLMSPQAKRFIQPSRQFHPNCRACQYFAICRGGCRRERETASIDHRGLNRYCSAYTMFFAHTMARMRQIARHIFLRR
jgi:uncharacterized protein